MITYPIHERFTCFQGEGVHMGLPAFFIRTYGCPVHCPFCDSAGTWHPNWVPKEVQRMTPDELVEEVMDADKYRVVITGGEPTIFDLNPLVEALHQKHRQVYLETSGAFEIKGNFDWITVSPKKWKLPLEASIFRADEFKIIVETPEDIDFYSMVLIDRGWRILDERPIWLHPEWSQRANPKVLDAISRQVMECNGLFRAGYQIHKLYQVDQLDARSRPIVPLGGDVTKGY